MGALARLMDIPPAQSGSSERGHTLIEDMRRQIDALGDISRGYSQLSHQTKQRKLRDIHLKLRDLRDELAQLVATANKEA